MLRLLIAVDGSPAADRAIEAVAELSNTGQAQVEVTLVNIRELPIVVGDLPVFDVDELDRYLKRRQNAILSGAAARALDLGLKVTGRRGGTGVPATEIIAVSEQCHADQVILGSHGRDTPDKHYLGSVALRVLQVAQVPVLLVK